MKTVAIIPARSGSKGIINKNITLVGERPLIYWTIEEAKSSGIIDRVIVTTDSPEIADVAMQSGAEVPFLRPAKLAQDDTPGITPILHAIEWLATYDNYYPGMVMMLQPTSPLRQSDDIINAVQLANEHNADAVVSATTTSQHPYWMKTINDSGYMEDYIEQTQPVIRRQDLPPVFALNGAIYLAKRDIILSQKTWYTEKTYAYIMPPERSLDIDTPWDLYLADLILRDRKLNARD